MVELEQIVFLLTVVIVGVHIIELIVVTCAAGCYCYGTRYPRRRGGGSRGRRIDEKWYKRLAYIEEIILNARQSFQYSSDKHKIALEPLEMFECTFCWKGVENVYITDNGEVLCARYVVLVYSDGLNCFT